MTDHNNLNLSDWITTKQAAELTGYEPAHIRYLAQKESIQARKFGKAWMINRHSVQAYAEEMKRLGGAKHDPWRTGARSSKTDE